jgi:hypothetical protein
LCAQQQHHPQAQQRAVQDNSPTQNTTNQPTNQPEKSLLSSAKQLFFLSLKTPELFGNIEIKCLGKKKKIFIWNWSKKKTQ